MSPQTKIKRLMRRFWGVGGIAACVALVGCGGSKETPAAPAGKSTAAAKATGTPAPSPTAAPASTNRPPQFLSVFSTTDPKDPFNPRAKPKAAASTTATNTAPAVQMVGPQDIIAAIETGFTATLGGTTDRIALVHGLPLEQNRDTTLTITVLGSQRQVKVRPVRILRDAMEARVEGLPNVVTLKVRR
jgi:hypothetical protein